MSEAHGVRQRAAARDALAARTRVLTSAALAISAVLSGLFAGIAAASAPGHKLVHGALTGERRGGRPRRRCTCTRARRFRRSRLLRDRGMTLLPRRLRPRPLLRPPRRRRSRRRPSSRVARDRHRANARARDRSSHLCYRSCGASGRLAVSSCAAPRGRPPGQPFRTDSELTALNRRAGERVRVSRRLFERRARGRRRTPHRRSRRSHRRSRASTRRLRPHLRRGARPRRELCRRLTPSPGWASIQLEPERLEIRVPPGVELDLGATAKAAAADAIAAAVHGITGSGVLVSLGGDVAVAGPAPHAAGRSGSPTTTTRRSTRRTGRRRARRRARHLGSRCTPLAA